jgi:hypothetical protein
LKIGDPSGTLGKPYTEAQEEKEYAVGDLRLSPLTSTTQVPSNRPTLHPKPHPSSEPQVQALLDLFSKVNAHGTENLDPAFVMERVRR